ncbi:MAG: 30S ribosomal protein S20 [Clostridia bacterium]|nr:30S ribosomal protein S20 [Clostridia bacterium]
MPNIKSAIKRVSVLAKKTEVNKAKKSRLRTSLKNARVAVADQAENAEATVKQVVKEMDRAATKGLISKQKAARHKSQLARALNKAKSAQ